MKIHIKKGRHFARVWDLIKLTFYTGMFKKRRLKITFNEESFEYSEPDDYIGAYNKVLGRNHGLIPYARWGSTRLAWRVTPEDNIVEVVEFVEDRKGFVVEHLAFLQPGQPYIYQLKDWGWPCWTFFGGRYPAPEDIQITVERV